MIYKNKKNIKFFILIVSTFLLFTVITACKESKILINSLSKFDFFSEAFDYIYESESGYSNNSSDRGGETKFGISKLSYPYLDIKNLTIDEAKEIYFRDFWKKYNLDKIQSKALAIKLFDSMILIGPRKATLILEEVVFSMGFNIPIDGIFDPELMNIINSMKNVSELIDRYQIELEKFFYEIVKFRPSQKIFLNGWINRARREILG